MLRNLLSVCSMYNQTTAARREISCTSNFRNKVRAVSTRLKCACPQIDHRMGCHFGRPTILGPKRVLKMIDYTYRGGTPHPSLLLILFLSLVNNFSNSRKQYQPHEYSTMCNVFCFLSNGRIHLYDTCDTVFAHKREKKNEICFKSRFGILNNKEKCPMQSTLSS